MMISLGEYAQKNGIPADHVRHKVLRGTLPAVKSGHIWLIEEDTPYIDGRVKSGKYINWRKK